MKVAILNQTEYPQRWEVLTERVRATLAAAGHEALVLCREPGPGASETSGTTEIVPMIPAGAGWWSRLSSMALPLNPRWVLWLRRQIRARGIDVLIVRDLRLAPAAVLAGRWTGIPVVLYYAENYAGMVRSYGKQRAAHWLIRQPKLVAALEFWCARRAARIWVVAEENGERLQRAGVRPERISVIHNVPLSNGKALPRIPLPAGEPKLPLHVLFIGQVTVMRCLDRVLEGFALLDPAERSRVKLAVFGEGPELPTLRRLAHAVGLEHEVEFGGWQSLADIAQRVAGHACVGIVPHHVNELTDTTVPNKLFDYMAMEMPVFVTNARPLQRIVTEERCGWVTADTAADIARGLRDLLRTPAAELRGMASRGYEAIQQRYQWSRYQQVMLQDLTELTRSAAGPNNSR